MKYRIDVLRNYVPIGELPVQACSVNYNAESKIKRSASITCNMDMMRLSVPAFEAMSDRISPVIITDDGTEHREGVFMVISSPKTYGSAYDQTKLELYDESYILEQSAFDTRHYFAAGTLYTTVFSQILTECGLNRQYIDESTNALQIDREFAVGDNILNSLNALLEEAGFESLHMDGNGYAKCIKKRSATVPDFIYKSGAGSIIHPDMSDNFDVYGIPNVFVGLVSTPDHSVMTYTAENHNLDSVLSIERRGYKLTKVYRLDSAASQAELEAYIDKLLNDSMMAVEGVNLVTDIEPEHGFQNCLQIEHGEVSGLFVEKQWSYSLETGASMQHYAEKKVIM